MYSKLQVQLGRVSYIDYYFLATVDFDHSLTFIERVILRVHGRLNMIYGNGSRHMDQTWVPSIFFIFMLRFLKRDNNFDVIEP